MRHLISSMDPMVVDTAIAIGLTVLVCIPIWVFSHPPHPLIPSPPNARDFNVFIARQEVGTNGWAYIWAMMSFLPLAVRRRFPWVAFGLSGASALIYSLSHFPPAFVTLGPMIAIYTTSAQARSRRVGLLGLLVFGLIVAVVVFAFSSSVRWVADSVGAFVLIAAAALLGEAARNRREYIEAVEQRALEAERTREEEALRRVDEERIRIAREVHDIVAHSLSIVTIQAGAAAALLPDHPDRARESIEHVRSTGKRALSELRSMLDVLRTGRGDVPLEPAADLTHIAQLVEPVRQAGLDVVLDVTGDAAEVPAYASVSAYRIVQEALTNVVRHANAARVIVDVAIQGDRLDITVMDDGVAKPAEADAIGHGIQGMRERVEVLGGSFDAGPNVGDDTSPPGFRVAASIPFSRSA